MPKSFRSRFEFSPVAGGRDVRPPFLRVRRRGFPPGTALRRSGIRACPQSPGGSRLNGDGGGGEGQAWLRRQTDRTLVLSSATVRSVRSATRPTALDSIAGGKRSAAPGTRQKTIVSAEGAKGGSTISSRSHRARVWCSPFTPGGASPCTRVRLRRTRCRVRLPGAVEWRPFRPLSGAAQTRTIAEMEPHRDPPGLTCS